MFKVIIVDDELSVIRGLKALINFERLGFKICQTAQNGKEAIKLIDKFSPDLIITDIRMPTVDGLELIEHCFINNQKTPKFIILSGYNDFNYAKTAMKYNVKYYLLKPIDEEELVEILKTIKNELDNEIDQTSQNNLKIELLLNTTANRIIMGETKKNLLKRFEFLTGISDKDEFRCIIIDIDNYTYWIDELGEEEAYLKKKIIKENIFNLLGNNYKNRIFENNYEKLIILYKEDMSSVLNKVLENIRIKILQEIKSSITVYVGNKKKGIQQFKNSYDEALAASKYKFFKGKNTIIFYDDIKNTKISNCFKESVFFSNLGENFKFSNKSLAQKNIEEIFSSFESQTVSPKILIAYLNNLTMEILSHINEMNGDIDRLLKVSSVFEFDCEKMTMLELKKEFSHFFFESIKYLDELKKNNSEGIIHEVKDYIKANYMNDINLKKIASHFFLNPVYLGQLFKNVTDSYFNDYLHIIRIDHAKSLLENTELKMYEIANSVGYKNYDYFIIKFEKLTNMSPSKYKKLSKIN